MTQRDVFALLDTIRHACVDLDACDYADVDTACDLVYSAFLAATRDLDPALRQIDCLLAENDRLLRENQRLRGNQPPRRTVDLWKMLQEASLS